MHSNDTQSDSKIRSVIHGCVKLVLKTWDLFKGRGEAFKAAIS